MLILCYNYITTSNSCGSIITPMVLYDATNNQGLCQDIDFWANTDTTTYSLTHKIRNINAGLQRVAFKIQSAQQAWQWDDNNNTDLPIATTDLVNGQQDYSIDTSFLRVLKVMIKDSAGNWIEIMPIDVFDPLYKTLVANTTNGLPTRYDKTANSILLYLTPNYNSTGGLRIYFQRDIRLFSPLLTNGVPNDAAVIPGFNPQFHRLVSLYAAEDLVLAKDLPQIKNIQFKITELENDLMEFYSNRGMDEPPRLRARVISSR